MAKLHRVAITAKRAADNISALLADEDAEFSDVERTSLTQTFNIMTKLVADNNGPAWNASEEQWEY